MLSVGSVPLLIRGGLHHVITLGVQLSLDFQPMLKSGRSIFAGALLSLQKSTEDQFKIRRVQNSVAER